MTHPMPRRQVEQKGLKWTPRRAAAWARRMRENPAYHSGGVKAWADPEKRKNRLRGICRAWEGRAGERRRRKVGKAISLGQRKSEKFQKMFRSRTYRRKLSKSAICAGKDPKLRKFRSKLLKARIAKGEMKRKTPWTDKERRAKSRQIRKTMKTKKWKEANARARANSEFTEKQAEALHRARRAHKTGYGCPSKSQISFFRKLCRAGIKGLKLEYLIPPYSIDIAYINRGKKVAIECDGPYFHKNKRRDRRRDKFLRSLGWKVVRIKIGSRKDVKSMNLSKILRKIER